MSYSASRWDHSLFIFFSLMSQPSLNRMQTTTLLVYESTYLKSYFIITRIKVLQSLCKNHLSLKKVIIRTLLFMLERKENSEWSRCKDVSLYIMMLKHLHSTCVEQIRFLSLTFLLWLESLLQVRENSTDKERTKSQSFIFRVNRKMIFPLVPCGSDRQHCCRGGNKRCWILFC